MGNSVPVPANGKKSKKSKKETLTSSNGNITTTASSTSTAINPVTQTNGLTSSDKNEKRSKKEPQKLELAKPVETSSSSEEETQQKAHPFEDDDNEEDSSDTNSFEMIGSSKVFHHTFLLQL